MDQTTGRLAYAAGEPGMAARDGRPGRPPGMAAREDEKLLVMVDDGWGIINNRDRWMIRHDY